MVLRGLVLSLSLSLSPSVSLSLFLPLSLSMCSLFHLGNKCLGSKGFLIVVMLTLEREATPLAFEGAKY